MADISFQQNIIRVVHLEVVQGGTLNMLIPNTCLQQPMSGKSVCPLGNAQGESDLDINFNSLQIRIRIPDK